jgi:pyruvate/2-oxoglutarate dehydrogenase complex dihydrolipoamide dehydrogenase (E3) component
MTEDNHRVKLRIVYDKKTRRILGAQMASRNDISMGIHLFSLAIEEKLTIDRLKLLDIFFLPHFNQPYNYITMAALSAV